MMRKCHLNTCPVGVATQDPVLRKRFVGQPEHVINFFFFVAEEVRELMAKLGYRTFDEMVGQMQMLDRAKVVEHWKAHGLDFSKFFHKPAADGPEAIYHSEGQDHQLEKVLDRGLIAEAQPAIQRGAKVRIETTIRNTDRTAGAMLSGEIARVYGHAGLPDETIHIKIEGHGRAELRRLARQGRDARTRRPGQRLCRQGPFGRQDHHLSAGGIARSCRRSRSSPATRCSTARSPANAISAASRASVSRVRNSGAITVVEGTGDHGCEYMTGGIVVVIGKTGRNFAAGMSGGIAYVLDEDGDFAERCNLAMVELEPVVAEEEKMQKSYHQGGDLDFHGRVDVMRDMTRFDAERLHQLISNHAAYTGSTRARLILDNWDEYKGKFRKVMPVEYRRALAELMAQEEDAPPFAAAGE